MMKRLLALTMVCVMTLCGCSHEAPAAPVPTPETPPVTSESAELAQLRADMDAGGAILGVAYLGSAELPGFEDLSVYLEANGFGDRYPFLYEIPEERLVRQDGCDILAVVPASPDVTLTISEYSMDEDLIHGTLGEELLTVNDGQPAILIGTVTEIFSNLYIHAQSNSGLCADYIPYLNPAYSFLPPAEGVYDFTATELLGQFEPGNDHAWWLGLCDTWYTRHYNGDDELMAMTLTLEPDGRAEYSYGYPNGEVLERFEGSWTVPKDQQLMLDLYGGPQSFEGSTTPGEAYGMKSLLNYNFYGNTLVLDYAEGTPLLHGADEGQFKFLYFDGFNLMGDWVARSDYWGWVYELRLFDNGECWFDIYDDAGEQLTAYEGWWSVENDILDFSVILSYGQHPETPELDHIAGSYLASLSGTDELTLYYESGHILTVNMEGEGYEHFRHNLDNSSAGPVSIHDEQDIYADLSDCDRVIVDDTLPVDAVFCTMVPVEDFKVVSLLMQDDLTFEVTDLYEHGTLEPDCPLIVTLTIYGTVPGYGISFIDPDGMYRVCGVTLSGLDGSLELVPLN